MTLIDQLVSRDDSPIKVYREISNYAMKFANELEYPIIILIINNKGNVIFPFMFLPDIKQNRVSNTEPDNENDITLLNTFLWLCAGINLGSEHSTKNEKSEKWLIDLLIRLNKALIFAKPKDALYMSKGSAKERIVYYRWKKFETNKKPDEYYKDDNYETQPESVKIELPVIGGLGPFENIKKSFIGNIAVYPKPDGKDNIYSIKLIATNYPLSKEKLKSNELTRIYEFISENFEFDFISFLLSNNIRSQNSGSNSDCIIRYFKMEFGNEIVNEILKSNGIYENKYYSDFLCKNIFCSSDFLVSRYLIRSLNNDLLIVLDRIFKSYKERKFVLKTTDEQLIPNGWTEIVIENLLQKYVKQMN